MLLLLLLYLFAFAQTQELAGNTSNAEIEISTEHSRIYDVFNNSTTEIYPNVTTVSKIVEVADNVTLEKDDQNTNKTDTSEVRVLTTIDNDDNSTQIIRSKFTETIKNLTSGDGENITKINESERIYDVLTNSTTEIYPNVTTVSKIVEVADNVTLEKDDQNTNKTDTSEVRVLTTIDNDDNSTQIIRSKFTETIKNLTSGDGENITKINESEEPIKKVKVQFLYETGCPYSRRKFPEIEEVVKKLGPYIDLATYPFGNADMTLRDSELSISCQHGERECYGNRLHACAIDILKDPAVYIPFNSCMMLNKRRTISNDDSADSCGFQHRIFVEADEIKSCAKGYRGFLLLVRYGIQSEKLNYPGVPWWIVNGVPQRKRKSLMKTICAEIKKPLPVCESSSSEEW